MIIPKSSPNVFKFKCSLIMSMYRANFVTYIGVLLYLCICFSIGHIAISTSSCCRGICPQKSSYCSEHQSDIELEPILILLYVDGQRRLAVKVRVDQLLVLTCWSGFLLIFSIFFGFAIFLSSFRCGFVREIMSRCCNWSPKVDLQSVQSDRKQKCNAIFSLSLESLHFSCAYYFSAI
jgi:hypothetical protein